MTDHLKNIKHHMHICVCALGLLVHFNMINPTKLDAINLCFVVMQKVVLGAANWLQKQSLEAHNSQS